MKRKARLRHDAKAATRRVILNRMFSNFYGIEGKTVEDAKTIIRPYRNVIRAQYKYLEDTDPWEPDVRSGWDTYGYEHPAKIMYDLQYISDRWNCSFRLRWVYDLFEAR